ncbi:hypothetical protein FACS189481_1450 [Clostridia bacterium]|nr:hypothetical protein FACS189481_1450 [Clostridia bacterium]
MSWMKRLDVFKKKSFEKKQTLIWIVLVLVCAVFFVLTFSGENVFELPGERLLDVKFKTVKKIEVTNPSGGYVIHKDVDELRLQSVAAELVDAEKLKDFVNDLFSSKISKVDVDKTKDTSNVQVTLKIECKGKTFNILVRDEAPADLGRHVSVSGKQGVYLLPKSVADLLFCSHLDFVSKILFKNFDASGNFDEIVFSDAGSGAVSVLKTVGENSLVLIDKGRKTLLLDACKDQIDKLVGLQAGAVKAVDPTVEEQDACGVYTPHLRVTIKRGTFSETIRISKSIDDMCFVLSGDGRRILECNVADFGVLTVKFDDLCKKHLVEGNLDKIKSLVLKKQKKHLNVEWQSVSNSSVKVNGKEIADEKIVSGLNELLESLAAFPLGKSISRELNEDKESELSLEIGYASESSDSYEFWANDAGAYVKYGKNNLCLAIEKSDLKELLDMVSSLMTNVEASGLGV